MIKQFMKLLFISALVLQASCDRLAGPDAADFLAQGLEYRDRGEWSAARIAFRNAVRLDGENGAALYALADMHLRFEDAISAESTLLKARELEVSPVGLQALLARIYYRQAKFNEVVSLQLDAALTNPEQALVMALQGMSYLNLRQWKEAEHRLAEATETDPNSIQALVGLSMLQLGRGELVKARAVLGQALSIDETNAQVWSAMGNIDRIEGNYSDSVAAFSRSIDRQVIGSRDRLSRVFLNIQLNSYDEAQADIAFLRSNFDSLPALDYAEGLIYFQQENYARAQVAFDKTLAIAIDFLPAFFYLGASHFQQKNDVLALQYLQKFHAEIPDDVNVVRLLTIIRLKNSEFELAEALIRPVVERDPQDVKSLSLLASALLHNNKLEESIGLLERVVDLEPDSAAARMGLGIGLLSKGETAAGVQQLDRVHELDPEMEVDLGTIVLLHLQNREFEQAVIAASRAIDAYPDNASAHYLLGTALRASGDKGGASEAFKNAVSVDAGHLNSLYALASMALEDKAAEQAKIYYLQVLDNSPGDLRALRSLAIIEGSLGNERAMLDALELAVEKNPNALPPRLSLGRYYSRKNQPEKVIAVLQDVRFANSKNPTLLALLGESQLVTGNYQLAVNDLSALRRLAPGSVWAHYSLAQAYAGTRDVKHFESELLTVLELDDSHFEARLNLSRFYLSQNNLVLAEAQIGKLVAPPAQEYLVLALKGELALALGDNISAIDFHKQAFAKRDSNINMLLLESAYWNSDEQKAAVDLLNAWITEHPEDQLSLTRLASRKMMQGQRLEALSIYKTILVFAPNNIVALNNLAWELRDEDHALALEHAEKAASLAPDSSAVMDTLAVLYTESDAAKAEKYIMRALDREPENADFQYHQAKILIQLGDKESARILLRSLLGKAENKDFGYRSEAEALLDSLLYSGSGTGQG